MRYTHKIPDLELELSGDDPFADPLGQATDSLPLSLPIKVSDHLGQEQSGSTTKSFTGQGEISEAQIFREFEQHASYSLGRCVVHYVAKTSIQRREWRRILLK